MDRPVVIRYPDDHPTRGGAEYELPSVAAAREVHPKAEVVMFADDMTPYDPHRTTSAPDPENSNVRAVADKRLAEEEARELRGGLTPGEVEGVGDATRDTVEDEDGVAAASRRPRTTGSLRVPGQKANGGTETGEGQGLGE